jgi:hypothetical protein
VVAGGVPTNIIAWIANDRQTVMSIRDFLLIIVVVVITKTLVN